MDEMYIKQDLVYDKHTGEIVGFTNLGDINNHLIQLERACLSAEESSNEPLARTVMVFMVKGLFQHLAFPFAHFSVHECHGRSADRSILGGSLQAGEGRTEGMEGLQAKGINYFFNIGVRGNI